MKLTSTLIVALLSSPVIGEDEKKKGDAEKLIGSWRRVEFKRDGSTLKIPPGDRQVLTFNKGGAAGFDSGDGFVINFKYSVDATKNPKRIDMKFTGLTLPTGEKKPNKNAEVRKSIYSLEGDRLVLCHPPVTQFGKRPAKFSDKGTNLETYVRVKKKDKK